MTSQVQAAVLIVEDEAIVATDLQETLTDMGYDAFAIAASGDEALARASERCPDIVLMDVRIRGHRDGVETATLLREKFDVPIVYLTAHADEHTVARAKGTQPFGYLTKPVKPADLRTAIELSLHRHVLERRLRERERWFSTTLDSIADAVIAVDLGGTITFMNPAAAALTGVALEHAIGRPAREVVRLLDPRYPASPLELVLEQKRPIHIEEAPLYQETRATRIISDSTAPVLDEGQMLGAVMVFRDVTEQKRIQKQLELTDRLASLGTMAAGVAHEVNNPLAVVVGNASFVLDELPKLAAPEAVAAVLEATSEIAAAAARITKIVAELQAFSRPSTPAAGESDAGAAVSWAIRSTAHEYRHRARVTAEISDGLRVALDETRLGQVLVNLLMNAAHAIPVGAADRNAVTIVARQADSDAVIEVRDTGCGMPHAVIEHIFEPFYTTKDVGIGTGLGLAICHGIVSSARGRIEVESESGRGTTFRISLPLANAKVVAATTTGKSRAFHRGRILIADDEPLMLKAMARMLRDHDVVTTGDPREVLARLAGGERFDIIFSDMMMPEMTGMELYERMLVEFPDDIRKLVFVTGGAISARIADFLAVVPNPCLDKPVLTDELRTFVQQRLEVGT